VTRSWSHDSGSDGPAQLLTSHAHGSFARFHPQDEVSSRSDAKRGRPTICRCDCSRCLKRFCVCFAAGATCVEQCRCKGCENDESTEDRHGVKRFSLFVRGVLQPWPCCLLGRRAARELTMLELIKRKANAFAERIGGNETHRVHLAGCNCKQSKCKKRYCECFQSGVPCGFKCKCLDCANPMVRLPFQPVSSLRVDAFWHSPFVRTFYRDSGGIPFPPESEVHGETYTNGRAWAVGSKFKHGIPDVV
jgi:hypothetical protein